MKCRTRLARSLCFLACVAVVFQPAVADDLPRTLSRTADVALMDDGTARGVLVDAAGNPVSGESLSLVQRGSLTTETVSDAQGHFTFRGLRGGTGLIIVRDVQQPCRLWAPGTAPPSALRAVMIVVPDIVVRGQWYPRTFYDRFEDNPAFWYGFVAAAIAVPIAVIAYNQKPSGS